MRLISIALAASVLTSFATGCASAPKAAPVAPEPVALSSADFRPPPSDFDMEFEPSDKTPAVHKHDVEPMVGPKMVSQAAHE